MFVFCILQAHIALKFLSIYAYVNLCDFSDCITQTVTYGLHYASVLNITKSNKYQSVKQTNAVIWQYTHNPETKHLYSNCSAFSWCYIWYRPKPFPFEIKPYSKVFLIRRCFDPSLFSPFCVLACEFKDCTSQLFRTLNGSSLQMTECWIQNEFADGRLGLLLWWGEQLQREHSLSMLAKTTRAVSKQRVSGKLWEIINFTWDEPLRNWRLMRSYYTCCSWYANVGSTML